MRFRPMPILSTLSALSVVLLILLGNWQYERFSAKMAAADAPPEQIEAELRELVLAPLDGRPVQQVYGVLDGEPIWRRYVPVDLASSDTWALVLLSVTGGPTPMPVAEKDLPISIAARMVARDPATYPRGFLPNPDDPDNALWYTFDGTKLGSTYGYTTPPAAVFEPVRINIVSSEDPTRERDTLNAYAFEAPPDPLPPERHFGYAMTWWGMAIALLGVYLALHHAQGRLRFRSE